MIRLRFALLLGVHLLVVLSASALGAQERQFTLNASPELIDSGFLKFLLPRFTLKNGTRANLIATGDAEVRITTTPGSSQFARPVFAGNGQAYFLILSGSSQHSERFADWLLSEIGQRTVAAFKVDDVQIFTKAAVVELSVAAISMDGDAVQGAVLALKHCGRCHVISEENRMKGIGSTPSFMLMRTFPDWENRFGAFYTLNPHPSFSQIAGITPPFDPQTPPPIIPLQLTQDNLEDILAYVGGIEPADLGSPIEHQ